MSALFYIDGGSLRAAQMEASTMDTTRKGLYKLGGASLALDGVLLLVTFGTFVAGPQAPTDPAEYLKTFATSSLNLSTIALFIAFAIVFVPGILGVYSALKQANTTWMLVATGFLFLGIEALFVTMSALVASVFLSQSYSSTSNASLQASYVAGAAATIAFGNSAGLISTFIISLGVLLIGMTMLKSVFGKPLAYLSVATGLAGLVGSATNYFALFIAYYLLYVVWFLWTGFQLWKLK